MTTARPAEPRGDRPRYVADTHALYWYLKDASRLSAAADAVFRLAESGNAVIVIPAIVVTELYFLTVKHGAPLLLSRLLGDLTRTSEFAFSDLGMAQLIALERLPEVPEIHDRLIAAESLLWRAPILTKDSVLRRASAVETIW